MATSSEKGAYLVLISVHGLIRGHDLELGRDADTGGQTKYVVEIARALAARPEVAQVDLVTRLVRDSRISADYSRSLEPLGEKCRLVRIEAGPDGYIPKEQLWDHLDALADNLLTFLREQERLPALVHSHYADAGYVGVRVASRLGRPLVHTGHSLGRDKRRQLQAAGLSAAEIESRYHMSRRILAEEEVLAGAALVVTSTHQEMEEQYGRYDYYDPTRMAVIPPGTDLGRFQPPDGSEADTRIARSVRRFLDAPDKPMILTLSRPDPRKNIQTLVKAYGESAALQEAANLVLIAGNREDIRELDTGAEEVWTELLVLIDRYDLYGRVAYPKTHEADDVPLIYRLAAASRGVFVNPALTEPFGLTLIEASASGLPIVATDDGGPQEILKHTVNGFLVDPLDQVQIQERLLQVLGDAGRWEELRGNGLQGVTRHYSWEAHASSYLQRVAPFLRAVTEPEVSPPAVSVRHRDRALVVDLDLLLLGERDALPTLIGRLWRHRRGVAFGLVTNRKVKDALELLNKSRVPAPDVLIAAHGTEIYYGKTLVPDEAWTEHIDHEWRPRAIRRVLGNLGGLEPAARSWQSAYRLWYRAIPEQAPDPEAVGRALWHAEQNVRVVAEDDAYVITPARASKGTALRWFAEVWDIPLERTLAAGGTASDEDMLRGNTLAATLPNAHADDLEHLRELADVFFASAAGAPGVLEAIDYYDFFEHCRVPDPDADGAT